MTEIDIDNVRTSVLRSGFQLIAEPSKTRILMDVYPDCRSVDEHDPKTFSDCGCEGKTYFDVVQRANIRSACLTLWQSFWVNNLTLERFRQAVAKTTQKVEFIGFGQPSIQEILMTSSPMLGHQLSFLERDSESITSLYVKPLRLNLNSFGRLIAEETIATSGEHRLAKANFKSSLDRFLESSGTH